MGITQHELLAQLTGLERQRSEAQAQLLRVEGALQVCRGLLAHLERQQPETPPAAAA